MQAMVEFWRSNQYDLPTKISYGVPLNPYNWPTYRDCLVKVLVPLPKEQLEGLIEQALALGWGFNPHTQTFYRLD